MDTLGYDLARLSIQPVARPIRAYRPPDPTLEAIPEGDLCKLKPVGQCTDNTCKANHAIRRVQEAEHAIPSLPICSVLQNISRVLSKGEATFSTTIGTQYGPKHDNDFKSITDIKVLPTTDEIISILPPYMPTKYDGMTAAQLLDVHFRQARYDVVEPIIDACYDGLQRAVWPKNESSFRHETPRGLRYSLFGGVQFESIQFHPHDGAMFKLSYDCPHQLRGFAMLGTDIFEKQKMCSLLAIHRDPTSSIQEINILHFEVKERIITNTDPNSTESRTRASICATLADKNDISKVRQATCYGKGLVQASFYLVNLQDVLPASFMPVLKRLQESARMSVFPLAQYIASPGNIVVPPPSYALKPNFSWKFKCLERKEQTGELPDERYEFKPMLNGIPDESAIIDLKNNTTLDDGQAVALYENLSRCLAFTQGPPGTGKTFLGVAEAEVILNSQVQGRGAFQKPIVVICATNHALDDFVTSLVERGMNQVVRLGNRSTNSKMEPYLLQKVRGRKKLPPAEWQARRKIMNQIDQVATFGTEWGDEMTKGAAFRLLQDYLHRHEPDILREFNQLDASGDIRTELRFLKSSSAGFAFDYWLRGGDLNGISSLLEEGIAQAAFPAQDEELSGDECVPIPLQPASKERSGLPPNQNNGRTWADVARKRQAKAENRTKSGLAALQTTLNEFQQRSKNNAKTHRIWLLNFEQRQRLFQHWLSHLDQHMLCDMFAELHRRHQDLAAKKWAWIANMDASIIQDLSIQVVALTATGAARNWEFLYRLRPETYIMEEASELTEPVTIATMVPTLAHLIKIGDPLQLRPHVTSQVLCTENDTRYRLDESLFERMMAKIPYSKLNLQRRAHPDMANLLRAGDYPYLLDNASTNNHPCVPGFEHRIWWLTHELMEDNPDPNSPLAKSFSNKYEVEFIAAAVRYLVQRKGYNGRKITVLSPYNGQVAAFTKALATFCKVLLNEEDRETLVNEGFLKESEINDVSATQVTLDALVRVTSVDNYQGEENDIIFLSTVRSNHNGKAGFLANQNRINVAISRARNGLYVVGNSTLLRNKVEGWRNVIEVFESHGRMGPYLPMVPCAKHQLTSDVQISISTPQNFDQLPDCHALCAAELPCGHFCSEDCHPEEMHHDGRMKCSSPCTNLLNCGHRCSKLCYEECGPCNVPMEQTILSCGHKATLNCSTDASIIQCQTIIRVFPGSCGHIRINRCGTGLTPCEEPCKRKRPCGHGCLLPCGTCKHEECEQRCGKTLPCGHLCAARCHFGETGGCPPCQQPCSKSCEHGSCRLTCSEPCKLCIQDPSSSYCQHQTPALLCCLPASRLPCSEPCSLMARCGLHRCQGLCGEECPDICDICDGKALHDNLLALPCGHFFDVQKLDARFSMDKLYKMDGIDIKKVEITGLPNPDILTCPTCSISIKGCPRYALCLEIFKHNDIIVGLLNQLGLPIRRFLIDINEHQYLLSDVKKVCSLVKAGPIGYHQNQNQESVAKPLTGIRQLRKELERYKDTIVTHVQDAIISYLGMLGISDEDLSTSSQTSEPILGTPSLPLLLRCDRLLIRCDSIMARYLLDVHNGLRARKDDDNHLNVFMRKTKEEALVQLIGRVETIDQAITTCQASDFKRLEVEFICQKSIVVGLLRLLNQETKGLTAEFDRASKICRENRGARVLQSLVTESLDQIMKRMVALKDDAMNRPGQKLHGNPLQLLWQQISRYAPGKLKMCEKGHYYCSGSFAFCPEC